MRSLCQLSSKNYGHDISLPSIKRARSCAPHDVLFLVVVTLDAWQHGQINLNDVQCSMI